MMNQKTGLVLEGGAMRGLFSAGVLDVMMENGIEFDGIMGVSAGAVFGCNYKSGQIGRWPECDPSQQLLYPFLQSLLFLLHR